MKTLRAQNLSYAEQNSAKTLRFCFNMMTGLRYLVVDQHKPGSLKSLPRMNPRAVVKFKKDNVECSRSSARGKEEQAKEGHHWSRPIYGAFSINSELDTSI